MKTVLQKLLLVALSLLIALCACTKHVITTELEKPLHDNPSYFFAQLEDQLPQDTKAEDKPTAEELSKFKDLIITELMKQGLIAKSSSSSGKIPYELRGAVLSYKAGSGFLRFLFGAWVGAAKMTVSLELYDNINQNVIFAGNFTQKVTSWLESRDEMYKRIAKDFAKTLKKQREKITGKKIEEMKANSRYFR